MERSGIKTVVFVVEVKQELAARMETAKKIFGGAKENPNDG